MLLGYFLSDSQMVPVALVTAGITLLLTFHARCPTVSCSHFKIVSDSLSDFYLLKLQCLLICMFLFVGRVCNVLHTGDPIISLPYIHMWAR